MKNKKTAIILALSVLLVICCVCAACKHTHSWQQGWSADAAQHWHACDGCNERADEAAHTPSQWVIDKAATETATGLKHTECTVCGKKLSEETIPATGQQHTHTFGSWLTDDVKHWKQCEQCGEIADEAAHAPSQWVIDKAATETATGLKHKECTVCGKKLSEETIPATGQQTKGGTVDLYAINDFHGEWDRLANVCGYFGLLNNQNNTVTLNSGDMFQGSMESNSNYGKLFSECMDIAGFDAFTFGNHEFDWGLDNLRNLAANSDVPFLGANIYNWDAKTRAWGGFADDLAQPYTIKQLENGLTVGIIGVIGKSQITSISSQLVQTIGFKDPAEIIPVLSQKLRNELGCDVVVVSAHTEQATFTEDTSFDITRYADAVFCAHSHANEKTMVNGIPFIQGGSNGKYVSHVRLVVDETGNVSCQLYNNESYSASWQKDAQIYNAVSDKISKSNAAIQAEANEQLAKLNGSYLSASTGVARMVAHAIAQCARQQGYDIALAMTNVGRSSLQQGNITYTALYEAIPFDNTVYIARVSGKDLLKEANYNSIYRVSCEAIKNSDSAYYYIAVLDYLLYHQNANRNYDYFPSAFKSGAPAPVALTKSGVDAYNYRLITRDFLREQKTVNASDYYKTNTRNDVSKLTQNVTLSARSAATYAIDAPIVGADVAASTPCNPVWQTVAIGFNRKQSFAVC